MMRKRRGHQEVPPGAQSQEVLFEFQRLGNILRVSALDPVSNTEITMIADPRQGPETIKALAARKLAYVIEKKRAKAERS